MDEEKFIRIALEQLKWEEFRCGTRFNGIRPLWDKLHNIQDRDMPFKFTESELDLLTESVYHSMNKISGYDYGSGFTHAQEMKLREEALQPLSEFHIMLKELKGA